MNAISWRYCERKHKSIPITIRITGPLDSWNDNESWQRGGLEEYPDWVYNDLAPWDYHTLPAALACKDWFTAKVKTNGELEAAMQKASETDTASYIEIVGGKHDYPAGIKLFHTRLAELYGVYPRIS